MQDAASWVEGVGFRGFKSAYMVHETVLSSDLEFTPQRPSRGAFLTSAFPSNSAQHGHNSEHPKTEPDWCRVVGRGGKPPVISAGCFFFFW